MTYKAKLPPAILLGADTPVGLTVMRELGEHGVSVHAVARSREGIGLYSKWITRGYLRPRDEDSTIELLNRIASEHGAQFLLAIAERDLLVIRAAADAGRLVGLQALGTDGGPACHSARQIGYLHRRQRGRGSSPGDMAARGRSYN